MNESSIDIVYTNTSDWSVHADAESENGMLYSTLNGRVLHADAGSHPSAGSGAGLPMSSADSSTDVTTGGSSSDIVAGGASEGHSDTIIMLTYIFYALAMAAVVQFLIKRLPSCIQPPYAVTLFALGAFLSYLHHTVPEKGWSLFSESIGMVENINPELVFFVILPPLLYESGSGLNWHVFRRLLWSALILAFPGVLLNLFFIGIFAFVAFGQGWTLPISFLLGSMLSTTDPVAVVAALHNLHAPDKLALLIDGESLLNDGSAIVGVLIFQNMIETGEFSFISILDLLFRCAIGGCLFGVIFAGVEVLFLKTINKFDHSSPTLETAVVVVGMFLCYLMADLLKMSGIIAVVSLAISMAVIGRGAFSPEGEEAVHTVVGQLAYFANQIIWLAGGHMTAAQLSQSDVASDPVNWIRMVALYLVLNIARGVSTWIMFPTLTRMGYGLNLKETLMLIYAGLRGAVCIALALLIRKSKGIDQHTLNEMGFYVAGAVMLTLVVNGSTIESVYRWLRIYPKRTWAQIQLQRAVANVDKKETPYLEAVKSHWFFKGLNLQILNEILPQFGKAEFNAETGQVHIPSIPVDQVMSILLDRYDQSGDTGDSAMEHHASNLSMEGQDNGFLYSSLSIKPAKGEADELDGHAAEGNMRRSSSLNSLYEKGAGDFTTMSKLSSADDLAVTEERVDRLVRLVQLNESRLKAAGVHSSDVSPEELMRSMAANLIGKKEKAGGQSTTPAGLYQSHRPLSDFLILPVDTSNNPFASTSSSSLPTDGKSSMEFSVTLPEIGIDRELIGVAPRISVGIAQWGSNGSPGDSAGSCGLFTESREIRVSGATAEMSDRCQFRRDFVRGDVIRVILVEVPAAAELSVTYMCGRYIVGECSLSLTAGASLATLYPTVALLAPAEQVELSFPIRTTTSAETRTESNAYLLNTAICLYEDLFKAGTISARSLRVLCDSVQYGIDAANDDLEVSSMRKRVRTIKNIYTKDREKYEAFEDMPGLAEDASIQIGADQLLSPLETEWGFIQLRHMKRVDCNDTGWQGTFLRLGELFGVRHQYKQTYRKLEELLAYSLVHSDLISHTQTASSPETTELVERLVRTSKSYLVNEVRQASPRDFYIAQHVFAAKVLLNIRRRVLEEFTKDGALTKHSVKELDEEYIASTLLALEEYTPSIPKKASRLWALRKPKQAAAGRPIERKVIITQNKE